MAYRPDSWIMDELVGQTGLSKSDAQLILDWCRVARERRPVVLVGTGFSRNAVPKAGWKDLVGDTASRPEVLLWSELAEKFREGLVGENEDAEDDPLWLAELYKRHLGPESLFRVLRQSVPTDLLEKGNEHKLLARIDWDTVLTTNYDCFIEQGFEAVQKPFRSVVSEANLVSGDFRATPIIHLHGIFDQPESIVIGLEDYRTYQDSHRGIVTKVRQLFLERPLLLIGFSATDPNFIQWSGWIRDLVGSNRIKAISLAVSENSTGKPRQQYWHDAISFVHVPLDRIEIVEKVLEVVNQATESISPRILSDLTISRIDRIQSIPEIIEEVSKVGGNILLDRPDRSEYDAQNLIEKAFKRASEIASKGSDLWGLISSTSAEDEIRTREGFEPHRQAGLSSNPSHDEQLQKMRAIFKENWGKWLLEVYRLVGPFFWVGSNRVSLYNEVSQLPANIPLADVDALRFRMIVHKLKASDSNDVDSVQEQWPLSRALNTEELTVLADIKAQRALRNNLVPDTQETDSNDPQQLRRCGFLSIMSGNLTHGANCYIRAARLARLEEPDHVEWLTIEAAVRTRQLSKYPAVDLDDPDIEDLIKRRDVLRARCRSWDDWLIDTESKAKDHLIKQIDQRHRPARRRFFGDPPLNSAIELMRFLESLWLNPFVVAGIAEVVGQLVWESGEKRHAVRLLARYGVSTVKSLVEDYSSSRKHPELENVIEELMTPGRWPSEWLAKIEALSAITREIPLEKTASLKEWYGNGYSLFLGQAGPIEMISGGRWVTPLDVPDKLADSFIGIYRYVEPEVVCEKLRRLVREAEVSDSWKQAFVSEVTSRLGNLPWETWLAEGFDSATAERTIVEGLTWLMGHPTRYGWGDINLVANIGPLLHFNPRKRSHEIPNFKMDILLQKLLAWAQKRKEDRRYGINAIFWIHQLSVAPDDRNAAMKAVLDWCSNSLQEGLVFPSRLQESIRDLAHMIRDGGIASEFTEDLLQLQMRLRERLMRSDPYEQDEHRRAYNEGLASSMADLSSAMLMHEPLCGDSDQHAQTLKKCIQITPSALIHSAAIPLDKLGADLGQLIEEQVVDLSFGSVVRDDWDTHRQVKTAITACWWRTANNPTDSLPPRWFEIVLRNASSEDRIAASYACSVLRSLISSKKLDAVNDRENVLRKIAEAILVASTDDRAFVVSQAGAAAIHAVTCYPELESVLSPTVDQLRADPRAEVRLIIRDTDARLLPATSIRTTSPQITH